MRVPERVAQELGRRPHRRPPQQRQQSPRPAAAAVRDLPAVDPRLPPYGVWRRPSIILELAG